MNILILGSGGREHALTLKIGQSKLCDKLFVAQAMREQPQLQKM
jgi:phosphoribosylamine--glycine ligase